jgi:serine/threonine protein kinase
MKTGDVKLTDFDVSFNLKKTVDADTISGTPNWSKCVISVHTCLFNFINVVTPEVVELKGATAKWDIWSFGCTCIELVTGKPLYSDLLAMSAMFHTVEGKYPPFSENISQEMKDFLIYFFQKDPDNRKSSLKLQNLQWITVNSQQKQQKQQQQQQQQKKRNLQKCVSTRYNITPSIKYCCLNDTTIQ